MANSLSKEANLKFSYQDFRCLDAPDLFINLWTYNNLTDHFPRLACETYSTYCENAFKKIWCLAWGDFKTVVEKIKKYDKDFINISIFSDSTKWEIINILINKNKKEII